jgi:hypothetical protein
MSSLVFVTTIVSVLQPNDQGLGIATQQSTGALVDRLERVLGLVHRPPSVHSKMIESWKSAVAEWLRDAMLPTGIL